MSGTIFARILTNTKCYHLCDHVSTCTFPEKGHDLGRYIHEHPEFSVNLEKPEDSAEVKELKHLLKRMLSRDPTARPLIKEVVRSLNSLRTTLGVQVVRLDTVWKPATLHRKIYFILLCFYSYT